MLKGQFEVWRRRTGAPKRIPYVLMKRCSIAHAFSLHDRAQFQSSMQSAIWDEEAKQWSVSISEKPKGGGEVKSTIKADFVMFASGKSRGQHW